MDTGSSAIINSGLTSRALAIDNLCSCPPLNSCGYFPRASRGFIPTLSNTGLTISINSSSPATCFLNVFTIVS